MEPVSQKAAILPSRIDNAIILNIIPGAIRIPKNIFKKYYIKIKTSRYNPVCNVTFDPKYRKIS